MNKLFQLSLQILVMILIICIPAIICGFIFFYYSKLLTYELPKLQRDVISECTNSLKKFYSLNGDYIITKCYFCSEDSLVNNDVILFIHEDKLRIINDFTSSTKDFGCYEILKAEIICEYLEFNNKVCTMIKCDNFTIKLGRRAMPFIKKNLLK